MKEDVILAYKWLRLRHIKVVRNSVIPPEIPNANFKRIPYLEKFFLEVAEGVRILLKLKLLRARLALELSLIEFLEASLAGAQLAVARDQALVVGLPVNESPGDT